MNWFIKIIIGIVMLAIGAIILALPVMLLWNWLMPTIFGLMTINFWQALGLGLLSQILFGKAFSSSK